MKSVFASMGLAAVAAFYPMPQDPAAGPGELGPRTANEARESFALALDTWRRVHGDSWDVRTDPATGFATFLYGGSATLPGAPLSDEEWLAHGRRALARTGALHGIATETLMDDRVVLLPLANAGSTDKMTVRYRQMPGGVPVVDGYVNVLFDMSGAILSVQSTAAPGTAWASTQTAMTGSYAMGTARRLFGDRNGVEANRFLPARLVFLRTEIGEEKRTVLAWECDLHWEIERTQPVAERYWIDATTGALLDAVSLIHEVDVTGTVSSLATPGTEPDTGSNPEVPLPMPHMRVSSSAGDVFTDENGNFTIPGTNGPLNVTVAFDGTYNTVENVAGAEHSVTVSLSGSGNSVLMNPAANAGVTGEANAYLGVNDVRDWIVAVIPSDTTADFQAVSNVNLNDTCNAFYNGISINFYPSGGGCVNTAYSTVVAHEYGHWLNVLYGTGNGSDGIGEGNADVFAMYLYDEPIVGEDFCGSGCHIRTGENLRQYCGDGNGGCYGQVHTDGEVWGGATWKVRTNLNNTHGNAAGDLIADTIFLSWMNAYDQTTIDSVMETQWLTLDDNDGNINNGTPNYPEIDAGFRTQGFPGIDLALVQISAVTDLPDTESEAGPYVVDATIEAPTAPPVVSPTLYYRVDGGAFTPLAMTNVSGDLYRANIPGQPSPAIVEYYVEASDSNSNTERFPDAAPATLLDFNVGVLTTFFFNEFEGGTDEGWTGGVAGDTATTGVWERVDPVATDAQPGNDHTDPGTLCWVTGQQPAGGSLGTNDVDGGVTTLLSPVFDASGLTDPRISYWRWYSNNTGAEPGADVFVVEISADGGSNWTNVETVGPTGAGTTGGWIQHVFFIDDVIAPTANMRLRFQASDLAGGSIVEAAVDDIAGTDLGPSSFVDCNANGISDATDISSGTSQDCNASGVPDECELSGNDCDANGVPDECDVDCDANGTPDACESFADCNASGVPDECELAGNDCDANGVPDECDTDCNTNGTPDACESFADCNASGVPDECELAGNDCDANGVPDECDADCNANGTPDACESFADCNASGVPDECELSGNDCDANGVPDECDVDCDANGTPDACESFTDCNGSGVPDECELSGNDCDANGVPDECDADCNSNGTPDACESFADCNANGTPDECELDGNDCDANGVPDECDPDCDNDGTPDACAGEPDCNANGIPDSCDLVGGDCNANGIPDECDQDVDMNGVPDDCEGVVGVGSCFGVGCPCGNDDAGAGCANSTGGGALLTGSGSTSVGADNLLLTASSIPSFNSGLFYMGDALGQAGFFDGIQCAQGNTLRFLDSIQQSDGSGTMLFFGAAGSSFGMIQPGTTWHFQCWYRDVPGTPCGTGANLSNVFSVSFTP